MARIEIKFFSKPAVWLFLFFFLFSQLPLGYCYMAADYLCQTGIKYYNRGQFDLALSEFQKALLADPDQDTARQYIDLITGQPQVPPEPLPAEETPAPAVLPQPVTIASSRHSGTAAPIRTGSATAANMSPENGQAIPPAPATLDLVRDLKDLRSPVEVERGNSLIIKGRNITRFLSTNPAALQAQKTGPNELTVTGENLGYTYLHVWDDSGRSTLELIVIPSRPKGPTFEQYLRQSEDTARHFKLRYSLDWSSFESGRGLDELHRAYYYYTHNISLTGDTPYGNLDSSLIIQTLNAETSVNFFTVGLENGVWQDFKGFSVRAFDFSPEVSNLAFPGDSLRGLQFRSPAFGNKLNYEVFWGNEKTNGISGSGLSPGLNRTLDSYLAGLNVNFTPEKRQKYSASIFTAGGADRPRDLNKYGYDVSVNYGINNWELYEEGAFDGESFAQLSGLKYNAPRIRVTEEIRDSDKSFNSMTGTGWRAGELGSLTTLSIRPRDSYTIESTLDVFQDHLFPSADRGAGWNEDFTVEDNWQIDDLTRMRLDYYLQNEPARLSEIRSHNAGIGMFRTFDFYRKFNTFLTYRFQKSEYLNSPILDYSTDKVNFGVRFRLINELYYYVNKEYDWTTGEANGETARPHVLETGLDWYNRLGNSPFWLNFRLTYRDEEATESPFSFLSGEDYLEWYGELTFKSSPELETYFNTRVRNVWADNPNVTKRIEVSLNGGMRYLWDTGLRWDATGMIEGFVFQDYNSDGLKQNNEPAIPGAKIWLGKNRSRVTNEHGYYLFTGAKGKSVSVYIDSATIPPGFVLTTPATQKAAIIQSGFSRIDFGVSSRTEISGMIFDDKDGDGKFSPGDLPLKRVAVEMEDGTRAFSDPSGRYSFHKLAKGRHKIILDLRNLPPEYIPTVSIFKEFDLPEGANYVYDFPLKKVPQK